VTAIKEGMVEKIQMLLNQEPGIINMRDRYDSSPLMRGKCLINNKIMHLDIVAKYFSVLVTVRESEQLTQLFSSCQPFFSATESFLLCILALL
jgi:hypothetical protein